MPITPQKPAGKPDQSDSGPAHVTSETPKTGNPALAGRHGFDKLSHETPTPKDVFAAAQAAAPQLTREYVDAFELSDEHLQAIADGSEPAPPIVGPIHTVDRYLTPGGWVSVPVGVDPAETPGSH
jgi:hypothetical protein